MSRWGKACWSDGVLFKNLRQENLKHTNDALIAETAMMRGLILVTNDKKLMKLVHANHGRTITFDDYMHGNYIKMKPSGIEWLEDIPEGWEVVRIKHGFRTIGSGTTPTSDNELYYGQDVPWVNTSELRENIIISTEKMVTEQAVRDFSALRLYPKGSVLFAMYGATIGRVAILGIDATVNQAVCVMANPLQFSERYVYYGFQASRAMLVAEATGGGQPNLNAEKVREHALPCPPIPEQRHIADYLDRETTRIDVLIDEIKHSSELLKEHRSALITVAVTGKIPLEEMQA